MTFDQSDKVTWPDQKGLSSNIPDHLPTCVPTKYPQKLFVSLLKLKICSKSPILLSRMCFGFRISSLIHLATLTLPIQNQKCLKNAKNAYEDTQWLSHIIWLCKIMCDEKRNTNWSSWIWQRAKNGGALDVQICVHYLAPDVKFVSMKRPGDKSPLLPS